MPSFLFLSIYRLLFVTALSTHHIQIIHLPHTHRLRNNPSAHYSPLITHTYKIHFNNEGKGKSIYEKNLPITSSTNRCADRLQGRSVLLQHKLILILLYDFAFVNPLSSRIENVLENVWIGNSFRDFCPGYSRKLWKPTPLIG